MGPKIQIISTKCDTFTNAWGCLFSLNENKPLTHTYMICCHFLPRNAMRNRGLCCRPVSVRLSVCPSTCHSHLYVVSRGLKISSNFFRLVISIILVFLTPNASIPNSKGNPFSMAQNTGGGKKCIFDWNRRLPRKRCEIGPWLPRNVNRKSQVADRYVSVPMTSSDPNPGFKVTV